MARIIIWHGNRAPTYHHLSWFIIATEYVSRIIQTFALYWIFLNANVKMCSGYDEFRSNLYSAAHCELRFSLFSPIARKRVYIPSLIVYDNWYTVCSLVNISYQLWHQTSSLTTTNQQYISEGNLPTMYTVSLSAPQHLALSSISLFYQITDFHNCYTTTC